MNKLKEDLQKDLDLISKKIDEGYNNDYYIAPNLELILNIAEDQHIRLKLSKTIKNYIKNYEDNEDSASKAFIDNYHNYKDLNESLTSIGEKINDEYGFKIVDPRYKAKVNLDEAIKIVANFFKNYNKDIYDFYENFIINGKFYALKNINDQFGLSTMSDELLDPYLFIKKSNDIKNITVLAHEMIHVYLSDYQKYISEDESSNKYINGVNEVYSFFIEYLMLDYLTSINFNKRDIINYKKSLYSDLIEQLYAFYTLLEPDDIDFTNYDEVVLYNDVKIYSYGLYFLYHFYDQYKIDKDMAVENITNFMLDSAYYDFNHLINNYGLSEEKLRDYKVLLKHIEKIY